MQSRIVVAFAEKVRCDNYILEIEWGPCSSTELNFTFVDVCTWSLCEQTLKKEFLTTSLGNENSANSLFCNIPTKQVPDSWPT